jgi:hypothetical protein
VIPVPTITVGLPEEGVLGKDNQTQEDALGHRDVETQNVSDKQEKLRDSLTQQYVENIQALQDELEKAPEALEPALRRAIEVAEQAYVQALENLFS